MKVENIESIMSGFTVIPNMSLIKIKKKYYANWEKRDARMDS